MKAIAVALLAVALTACGGHPESSNAQAVRMSPVHVKATKSRPTHRVTYSASCNDQWPVVFQTSPPRLVSEVTLHNRGSAATRVQVWTDWFFFGGGSDRKMLAPITLAPGETKRVAVSKPVDGAELLKMAGWKHGDRMCRSRVTMLG